MEIEEILERLFREIQPLCDQHYDNERYENLDNYERIFGYLTDKLIECAKWKNDNRYSANRIGERAYRILEVNCEQIQDELRIIKENEED